jgi:hypothetical protein
MSSPRLATIAIVGLAAVTAAGLAFQQYLRAEALAAQLAQVREVSALVSEDDQKPESSIASSRENIAAPDVANQEAEKAPPPETSEPRERDRRDGGRGDMTARFEKLMADPEFAAAFQTQQRAALDGRYADLFKSLNLPPAELDKLKNLLAEKQNVMRDVMMAAQAEGLGRENRDELRDLVNMTRAEIDEEIRAAVGDQALAQIENYEKTTAQRTAVSQLETRLSYSGTPLNSAQSESLVTILSQTSATAQTRGGAPNGDRSIAVPITEDVIARAQAVLAPDQLQVLIDLQAEQQASQTVNSAFRSSFRPSGGDQRSSDAQEGRGPGG